MKLGFASLYSGGPGGRETAPGRLDDTGTEVRGTGALIGVSTVRLNYPTSPVNHWGRHGVSSGSRRSRAPLGIVF